jgi:hypothetical protein
LLNGPLLALSLLLLTGTLTTPCAASIVVENFDQNITNWYGLISTLTFDPAQDNTANGGGSCHAATDFSAAQLLLFAGTWQSNRVLSLSQYNSVEFDVKWDQTSTMSLADFNHPPAGADSAISVFSVRSDTLDHSLAFGSFAIPDAATNVWVHISIPIDPALPGIDPCRGFWFQKWIPSGAGTAGFWLDNIELTSFCCAPPPPLMFLQPAVRGLNLFTGDLVQGRQSIRTLLSSGDYSWVGSGPVSYSFTVSSFDAVGTNLQMHLFLVPYPDNTSSPDECNQDVLAARLLPQADGSAL